MPDLVSISNSTADAAGIPRLLVLAAGCAESGLNPLARRPANPSNDPISWPDVSFGAWQQTVRWAQEYSGGKDFPGAAEVDRVGALYLDPVHAAEVAANQLKAHYRSDEDDAVFKALCRYNWPAGNGQPKNAAVAANYRRGITEAEALLKDQPVPVPTPTAVAYDLFPDPQPAGTFAATPKGIILHGSRSGIAGNPKAQEYAATARYEVNNTADLGWNATIGEGRVAVHLTPREWGWNARAASSLYLGVELAQATVDEPITDAQVAAFCDWVTTHVLPVWPSLPRVFPTHAELDGTAEYGGYHDGKTDCFPKGDARADELRARIMAGLATIPSTGGGTVPASTFSVGPGILAKMAEAGDAPASDELQFKKGDKDEWAEAVGTSGALYRYVTSLNTTFRFPPAA